MAEKSQASQVILTHHSEESYHQILDSLGDLVLVKGPKSKLLWANKAFCQFYGMTNEQLRGIIDAPFNEPDFTLQYVKDDAHVFESGLVLDIPLEPVTRHDGVIKYFHTVKSPIFSASGEVIMTVGVSRDITEVKVAQEELEGERNNMLNAAKMATLGEMAAGIAHEINTPLAIIHTLSGQLKELLAEKTMDIQMFDEMVEKIESTSMRIAKIVSGLQAFSRDGSSGEFAILNIQTFIENTLAFSNERMTHHGIAIDIKPIDPKLEIDGNEAQLGQVVLNLLNNAHDAVVNLQDHKWIQIECLRKENQVEISVTDSGGGIPPEVLEKIFRPFFTTKEVGKGTGLGLSISKGIVESHDGTLSVDQGCKNTRFVIQIPIRNESLKIKTKSKLP